MAASNIFAEILERIRAANVALVGAGQLPPGVQTEDDLPPDWLSLTNSGWHLLSPAQDQIPPGDVGPTLHTLAAAALDHAASRATK